ncbi:MAG: SAM-dependent methyltransferase [Bacteroidetes bacterium]|nr:SAM-dependent methyltransferase [Bacteroidota bacterium]
MTPELNINYWNNLYLNGEFPWDIGSVSTPLKEYFDQLSDKTISVLIPGAGNAYEAEYLINNGFSNVYVCDFAEEPLKNLLRRCPAIKIENLLQRDFFEMENMQFDLIIEQTFFCALDPSLRSAYFKKMNSLLCTDGKLVGVMFNCSFDSDRPPYGGDIQEYLEYFKNQFEINTFEPCYNSIKPRAGREIFINLEKQKS